LGLRQLGPRLVQHRLKRARIDLKEQLALLHERTLFVRLLEKVTRHLRFNVGVDEAIQSADPFAIDRDVFLLYFRDFHGRRRCGGHGTARLAGATRGSNQHTGN